MVRFLISFLLCCVTISVYGSSSNLKIMDIDATEQDVSFRNRTISDRHKDLIDIERFCNSKLQQGSTTNLAVAKLLILHDDNSEREIPLQIGNNLMVFDSGTHRKDIVDSLKGMSVAFQSDMIDVDMVIERTARNFPAVLESMKFMNDRRDNMLLAIESKKTVEDARQECREKHTKLLGLIEIGSKALDLAKQECKQSEDKFARDTRTYYDNISPLVINVWHSEPRILSLLQEQTLRPRSLVGTKNPTIITLHLHSTNNVCNGCRLQLVGATYNWLYESVVCAFGNVRPTPKFHIIVTWFDDYPRTTFMNPVTTQEIKDSDFATFDYAHPNSSTFSEQAAGFFLTLVKLDKSKFSVPASGAVAANVF